MEQRVGRPHRYHIFGLNIRSEIAFMDIPETMGDPDVSIKVGTVPDHIANATVTYPQYEASEEELILRIEDVAQYYVAGGTDIMIQREPGALDEEILLFLMGSVMGALLHQRNILPLHGSAVAVNGQAVIFLGPACVGKSTLAGGFRETGRPLLADDICAVNAKGDERPAVIPGFPRLKLSEDSLVKLEKTKNGLNRVRFREDFDKYYVPFQSECRQPVPIRSVFILETTETSDFEAIELKGGDKIRPLIQNTYRPYFLEGLRGKTAHFRQCAAVAGHAAVIRLARPRKGFRLDALMDRVMRHW